jgi:hypothetical protein
MEPRAPDPDEVAEQLPLVVDMTELPRAPLPRRRPISRARSRDDIVGIDRARRQAGLVYSPAYSAWLDRQAARS